MVKGGKGRGKGSVSTPSTKRQRTPSDEIESEEIEIDPELIMDSLLACLNKKPTLLDKFLNHLLEAPAIQEKITEKVLGSIESNIPASAPDATTVDTTTQTGSMSGSGSTGKPGVAKNLITCLQDLTNVVQELKSELKSSKQRCDELEQYSRRNNIIISGVPESEIITTEDQAIKVLNNYVTEPIYYGEIDRCHRLYRAKPKNQANKKPADIIVKFISHRSKARILTKDPMEKLRADNNARNEKDRIYVREDLTKYRGGVLYKARQLKKAGLVKDAFTRDGTIIVRMRPNKPSENVITIRISNEEELKAFCAKFKLPVNDECVPLTKPKTTVPPPAIPSTSNAGVFQMEVQDSLPLSSKTPDSNLNADAKSFCPVTDKDNELIGGPIYSNDSG